MLGAFVHLYRPNIAAPIHPRAFTCTRVTSRGGASANGKETARWCVLASWRGLFLLVANLLEREQNKASVNWVWVLESFIAHPSRTNQDITITISFDKQFMSCSCSFFQIKVMWSSICRKNNLSRSIFNNKKKWHYSLKWIFSHWILLTNV